MSPESATAFGAVFMMQDCQVIRFKLAASDVRAARIRAVGLVTDKTANMYSCVLTAFTIKRISINQSINEFFQLKNSLAPWAAEPMRHGGSCLLRIWSPEARCGACLPRISAVKCC